MLFRSQQPELQQQVHMPDRPAELAHDALSIMHTLSTYQQMPSDNYETLWMTQSGNNMRRERHIGMMMQGLDDVENAR